VTFRRACAAAVRSTSRDSRAVAGRLAAFDVNCRLIEERKLISEPLEAMAMRWSCRRATLILLLTLSHVGCRSVLTALDRSPRGLDALWAAAREYRFTEGRLSGAQPYATYRSAATEQPDSTTAPTTRSGEPTALLRAYADILADDYKAPSASTRRA